MSKFRKKIGLLGLSADPPHNGHMEIVELLLGKKLVDEVWLIPCYEHSFGKPLSAPEHRWQMAKLLEGPKVSVSDVEFDRQGKSYAVDTVQILKEKYPDCQFCWVIGSDIVRTGSFLRWKDWTNLSFMADFLVVLRQGFEIKKLYPGFTLVEGEINDISSSEIREKVCHGLAIDGLVPPKVKEYIERHGLYKD